ncbi:MAG: transglycosylase domain-containing protein [Chthoniobacteraceae bacterium]|nr:transglycosylase domain-containing protein [Chthoniobacteraceae bacterium]
MWLEPPPKKPFYRRAWFLLLVTLVILSGLTAVGGFFYLVHEYAPKAAALDLTKLQDMETASIVFDRNGQQLGKIYVQNRETIPLSEMPASIVPALVSMEDTRFWQHHGVDYVGMIRATVINWRAGKIRQGASTITQQLARNSFPDALPSSDRSFQRKILEAFVAYRIEDNFSKQKILESYLNRVYFGWGFYGIEAAARGYFGKPARELNLSECATLAGMLHSPNALSPWRDRKSCIKARDIALGRMLELGWIKERDFAAAKAETLAVKNRGTSKTESYLIAFVQQQVAEVIGEDESVYGDGFRIYTTLDARLQKTAEDALKTRLEEVERRSGFSHPTYAQYDALYRARRKRPESDPLPTPDYLQGALFAIDNSDGGVLAMVGGRDFNHNQYNRALFANRSPGTGFLPIVYAAAFEKGIFPGAVFQDAPLDNRLVMIGGMTGILGEWGPETTDNQYEGPITAHSALVKSKNSASVRLGLATGLDAVTTLAKNARIDSPLQRFPNTYLGKSEVTLEDLTLAYTLFPDGGARPDKPVIVRRVETKDGKLVYTQPPTKKIPVLTPTTAWEVHSALAESLDRGSADKAYTRYGLKKFPMGGKTGTAYNFTDAWFIGYSSAVTCGVWTGFDSPSPIYNGAFSNEIALPIWVDFMNATFPTFPPQEIARPPGLQKYEICSVTGQLITPKCIDSRPNPAGGAPIERSTAIFEWGTPEQAPKVACELHTGVKHEDSQPTVPDSKRPVLASDPSTFQPVHIKSPTVLGNDPFHSITAGSEPPPPEATPTPAPTPAGPLIVRPEIVKPHDDEDPSTKLEAPAPIKFD